VTAEVDPAGSVVYLVRQNGQFVVDPLSNREPMQLLEEWLTWALLSPDGVAPSRLIVVCLPLLIFPCAIKSRSKFSSGTGSPGLSQKKDNKTVVVVVVVVSYCKMQAGCYTES